MTREEAQPEWEKIVDMGFADYEKLSREQRVWFNVEPLTTDGLWDHYMNHGADKNSDTIDDLEYLNFSSVANQLREFNKTYFPNGVPAGPDARQDELDKFPEDQLENDIEEMDDKFWKESENLEKALLEHINHTGIGK
ncbi:DMP19 family protein [Croceimicrobium sp.]|uniref:DMP19 family protein n=1 Tax=Croceimicrobium sp. TaxID=2828340 RepID=UPI003BABB1EA